MLPSYSPLLTYLVHFLPGSPDRRSEAFLEARPAFLSVAQLARNFTTPRRKPRDPYSRALPMPHIFPRHRPLSSCHLIIVVKPAGYPPKRSKLARFPYCTFFDFQVCERMWHSSFSPTAPLSQIIAAGVVPLRSRSV